MELNDYRTAFVDWQAGAGGFDQWSLKGIRMTEKGLQMAAGEATAGTDPFPAGGYNGGNYYNGSAFLVGEALSPVIEAGFDFRDAIASWNARTPAGCWIEADISARLEGRWTKWYVLGVWAEEDTTVRRHSVKDQEDEDGDVSADTLNLKEAAQAFQLKLRLFAAGSTGEAKSAASPTVRYASMAYSSKLPKQASVSSGDPAFWNRQLAVPQCSQMVYPNGGNVWCSPTSAAMVLMYWSKSQDPCGEWVPRAVNGVWDWIFDGAGNWPFNTAYAAKQSVDGYPDGLQACVQRFSSLAQLEPWIARGVPVIISIAWGKDTLTGAAVSSSNGHLVVLVGFDEAGNPIINDPAAKRDEEVRRTYLRREFEPLWLQSSGGTVYLIYPEEI